MPTPGQMLNPTQPPSAAALARRAWLQWQHWLNRAGVGGCQSVDAIRPAFSDLERELCACEFLARACLEECMAILLDNVKRTGLYVAAVKELHTIAGERTTAAALEAMAKVNAHVPPDALRVFEPLLPKDLAP